MTRYLTPAEYVDRYGDQEATRLTSEEQPPARDDTKIEAAIGDAEEVVDGYLARRYTLPLAAPPRVVKTWVATLAREQLHKTRPTPEVAAAADRTRSQLAQASAGTFRLLDAENIMVEATASDRDAMTSGPANRPSMADALADYTRLGGGSYCVPRWRQ